MFDFHSHLLPSLDDGSRSVEESLNMLRKLSLEGVSGVAATPHFYAEQSPEEFFKKRAESWEALKKELTPELPQVRLGAEIAYYEGISRMECLPDFCIEGTRLILVEMPLSPWTNRMIDALKEISAKRGLIVLLAHIERYFPVLRDDLMDELLYSGVLFQLSAGFVSSFFTRRRGMKLLKRGKAHLLGTDCHNLTSRPPNMKAAIDYINNKTDAGFWENYRRREEYILNEKVST